MLAMNNRINSAGCNLLTRGVTLAVHIACHFNAGVTNINYDEHCRENLVYRRRSTPNENPAAGATGLILWQKSVTR